MLHPNMRLEIGPHLGKFLSRVDKIRQPIHDLTRAERQVFDLMGLGLTNVEIARALCIERTTARTHVKRVHSKLNIDSRELLVAAAHQLLTERVGT